MENDTDTPLDWKAIKRRKFYIIIPVVIILSISAVIAFILPPIYRSTGTILIETQKAPRDLVQSTVTGYVEERLHAITQLVLRRTNLLKIIKRFNLYDDMTDRNNTEKIVQKMRKAIVVEPLKANIGNNSLITGFTLSYEGKDPEKVALVADVLVSSFLEENIKRREEKTRGTFKFLENQLTELRTKIQNTEEKIAEFKDKHMNELPELMQLNIQTMESLERDIYAKEELIKSLANQTIYLEGHLAVLELNINSKNKEDKIASGLTKELEILRNLYLSKSATLAKEHPDVIALKKKLDAMKTEQITQDYLMELHRQLEEKETELLSLSGKFSSKHPDFIKLNKEVMRLKTEIRIISEKHSIQGNEQKISDNPLFINLQTQISSMRMELKATQKQLELLKEKREDYQRRVENTPKVEQQYNLLMRDYANAQEIYKETQNRLMAASEAIGLEKSQMAERFILVDPPAKPDEPCKPNRAAILLMGLVLAVGAGIGFGIFVEHMDQSVHGADELAKVAGEKVLAVIPYLKTSKEHYGKRYNR